MRFRAGLSNPAIQQRAATAFAKRSLNNNTINDNSAAFIQLKTSAEKALSVFSGIHSKQPSIGGFTAIATVIDSYVKKEDAQQAATVILKVLTGVAWDVWQQARVEAGLPVLTGTPADEIFLQTALSAYSDSFFLDSPIVLHLEKAEHKQASVFQITKSPGQYGVYLGALCLVLGVFAMFYIKERRLWVWLRTHNKHNDMENQNMTELTWALSSPKRDSTFNEEYQQWQSVLGDKMPKL
jgi:cytochrome c biogenesis protein